MRTALIKHAPIRGPLWRRRFSTSQVEGLFGRVLERHGLAHLRDVHTPYSLRRGGASAARVAGVPMEVIESFGGWSAGSRALKEHYLDMSITASPYATTFFGRLARGQCAPFAQQYFNR